VPSTELGDEGDDGGIISAILAVTAENRGTGICRGVDNDDDDDEGDERSSL
jgi:hypothetical protein